MQYIDKSRDEKEGKSIIDKYLSSHWINDESRYGNIDYPNLGEKCIIDGCQTTYKECLEKVECKNQMHYCCYCQRLLVGEDINLEHIIPKSFSGKENNREKEEAEFAEYTSWNLPFLTKENIELSYGFKTRRPQTTPPYPHDISYHNLVVSCEGVFPDKGMTQQCCNHPRGIASIYPLFYDTNISNKIYYTKSGEILVDTLHTEDDRFEKIVKTITSLKLTASVLRDIRHLWYLLRNVPYAELKRLSDTSERRIQIDKVIDDTNERDIRIRDKFCKQEYWNSFLKYSWFQHYFKNKYP